MNSKVLISTRLLEIRKVLSEKYVNWFSFFAYLCREEFIKILKNEIDKIISLEDANMHGSNLESGIQKEILHLNKENAAAGIVSPSNYFTSNQFEDLNLDLICIESIVETDNFVKDSLKYFLCDFLL